jgi:hypothetical protein
MFPLAGDVGRLVERVEIEFSTVFSVPEIHQRRNGVAAQRTAVKGSVFSYFRTVEPPGVHHQCNTVRTAGEFPLLADRTLGKSVISGKDLALHTLIVLFENAMDGA